NITPVTGEVFCQVARGKAADIELALDAAHKAAPAWGKTSPAERALILHRIADRIEENLEEIAVADTWDNGKAVRETLAADIPLGRRPLPLLRLRPTCPGGQALPDRPRHRRLPLQRATGRRGSDHPLELPDPHGCLEDRTSVGCR